MPVPLYARLFRLDGLCKLGDNRIIDSPNTGYDQFTPAVGCTSAAPDHTTTSPPLPEVGMLSEQSIGASVTPSVDRSNRTKQEQFNERECNQTPVPLHRFPRPLRYSPSPNMHPLRSPPHVLSTLSMFSPSFSMTSLFSSELNLEAEGEEVVEEEGEEEENVFQKENIPGNTPPNTPTHTKNTRNIVENISNNKNIENKPSNIPETKKRKNVPGNMLPNPMQLHPGHLDDNIEEDDKRIKRS